MGLIFVDGSFIRLFNGLEIGRLILEVEFDNEALGALIESSHNVHTRTVPVVLTLQLLFDRRLSAAVDDNRHVSPS